MKKARARVLWNAGDSSLTQCMKSANSETLQCTGFRTVRQIAIANPEDIVKHTKYLGHASFVEGVARNIIRNARELLEKKAKELRETAEEMLQFEAENAPT